MRSLCRLTLTALVLLAFAAPANATPVCTDGYMGGPSAALCGGRIFPEAENAQAYVQYNANPSGFIEYQHGIEYLAQKYNRWVSVFKLKDRYGDDAVSAGPDGIRPYDEGDTDDGRDIWVIKVTDHSVPDKGKDTLLYSLSVHGNERGGLEGGLRTAEDLAMAATDGGKLVDGVDNYESSTGAAPKFREFEVRDLLAKQAVYLVSFNVDGWASGDFWNPPIPATYNRGNSIGTDLNRQMPSIGRINPSRNPLQESEARFGTQLMDDVASEGRGGRMAYGADIHGELNSVAYMDVMYPAGEFDSVDHRRLMAIAERTKSVIDATLYEGIIDEVESASGGNDSEAPRAIPTQARSLGHGLGHARLHRHRLHRRLHGHRARRHWHGLRDRLQPHGSREDLEHLPPGEPHQCQPRDHQDRDGAGRLAGEGLQQEEREGQDRWPRRLRGQPGQGDRQGHERPRHAARPGGGRRRCGRHPSRRPPTASRISAGSATRTS